MIQQAFVSFLLAAGLHIAVADNLTAADEQTVQEKPGPSESSASEKAKNEEKKAKKYPAPDPSMGHIEGRIVLKGASPEIESLSVPDNHQDRKACAKHVKSEVLILGKQNEIKNVVVGLSMKYKPPKRPKPREVVIDNKDCLFVPHVQVATVGSSITLKNSDPIVHNTQSLLLPPSFNNAIPPNGVVKVRQKYRRPGWGVVKCSYHEWMMAHVYIFPHENFDVTDGTGTYRLVNLPPGEHEVFFFHERLANFFAPVKKKVTVEAGKTVKLDVELEAPKKK